MKAKINSDNIPDIENIYKRLITDFLKNRNSEIKENLLEQINLHGKNNLFFGVDFGNASGYDYKNKITNYSIKINIDSNSFIISSNSPDEQGFVTIGSAFILNLGVSLLRYASEHKEKYNLKDLEYNFKKSDNNE